MKTVGTYEAKYTGFSDFQKLDAKSLIKLNFHKNSEGIVWL